MQEELLTEAGPKVIQQMFSEQLLYTQLCCRYIKDMEKYTNFVGPPWTYNLFEETVPINILESWKIKQNLSQYCAGLNTKRMVQTLSPLNWEEGGL